MGALLAPLNENKMENQIKVGQTCEVAVITDNSQYPSLYSNGNTGVIDFQFRNGNASICIGVTSGDVVGTWHVSKGRYKKTGKLTITKVK